MFFSVIGNPVIALILGVFLAMTLVPAAEKKNTLSWITEGVTNSAGILERKLLNSAEATSEKIILSLENIIQKYDNMTYSFSMMETVTDIYSHPGPDYDYSSIRKDRTDFENAMFSCIPVQIRNSVPV